MKARLNKLLALMMAFMMLYSMLPVQVLADVVNSYGTWGYGNATTDIMPLSVGVPEGDMQNGSIYLRVNDGSGVGYLEIGSFTAANRVSKRNTYT